MQTVQLPATAQRRDSQGQDSQGQDTQRQGIQGQGIQRDRPQSGPAVARMLVGTQLRRLREACDLTARDAGEAIRGSSSKISRMECGRTSFKLRDVADLLSLYGVADDDERATILALVEEANAAGWWDAFGDVVPRWFEDYLRLEQAASVIRNFETQFIPGLLQTEEYARAVIRLGNGAAPAEGIERRVSLRMRRQELLRRPDPPHVWAVIDEAALRRPMGGATTMRAQLAHLAEISELPNVTVQIMPFSAGGHAAAGGPITILRFAEDSIRDVVFLEQLNSAVYVDRATDIDRYWHVMNRLAIEAAPPTAAAKIIHQVSVKSGHRRP
jgi:transcriptional regulator with XRE-family HTH domain